uniref:Protein kinase domain-containing protein n=1 Tax=Aegilops tauschii subsp. strangulata TaxID=200361 RepID=A0A452YLW0_AEGTS
YDRHFAVKYELGKEVGRGHFGHTCLARARKGDMRGQVIAVKVISKAKVEPVLDLALLSPKCIIVSVCTNLDLAWH